MDHYIYKKFMSSKNGLSVSLIFYSYFVFLGAIYVWAFWQPFGFSVFSFFALQDFVKNPLDRLVVLILIPAIVASILLINNKPTDSSFKIFYFGSLCFYFYFAFFTIFRIFEINGKLKFDFPSEKLSLCLSISLVFWALVLIPKNWGVNFSKKKFLISILLIQFSTILSSGQFEGKRIYNLVGSLYYLKDNEICYSDPLGRWVFVSVFSDKSIFLNSSDKSLCFVSGKDFQLIR